MLQCTKWFGLTGEPEPSSLTVSENASNAIRVDANKVCLLAVMANPSGLFMLNR